MAFPPGPRTPGLLTLLLWMRDPEGTFAAHFRDYGDIYSLNNPLLGRDSLFGGLPKRVAVSHPALIKTVMTAEPFRGGEASSALSILFGPRSVLVIDGEEHHRQRKLLMPPFGGDRLARYAREMRRIAYAVACTDANMQPIQASSYDQSCQKDDDCVAVAEGNFCDPGATVCPFSGAINKSAYAQYQADVAKTNAAICGAASSCGLSLGPCCQGGTCQTGNTCAAPPPPDAAADSGDASAE